MKTFIIGAITADGFIAKNSQHPANWTSKADKEHFKELTKKAGVMVMGRNTFETIGKALPGRRTIVMSKTKTFEGIETTSETPEALVERLTKEGVEELAICGGTSIYSAFMKSNLVDKMYLTVEPLLFGQGLPLFNTNLEHKLKLESSTKIGDNSIVLKYSIIK
jgi:dihydrofolate reductase